MANPINQNSHAAKKGMPPRRGRAQANVLRENQTFSLLSQLPVPERKAFLDYAHYRKCCASVQAALQYLVKHPDFAGHHPQRLFAFIWPGQNSFDRNKLNSTTHKVKKVLIEFLAVRTTQEDVVQQQMLALEYSYHRSWYDAVSRIAPKVIQSLGGQPSAAVNNLDLYRTLAICHKAKMMMGQSHLVQQIPSSFSHLEEYFLIEALRNFCLKCQTHLVHPDREKPAALSASILQLLRNRKAADNSVQLHAWLLIRKMLIRRENPTAYRETAEFILSEGCMTGIGKNRYREMVGLIFSHGFSLHPDAESSPPLLEQLGLAYLAYPKAQIRPEMLKQIISVLAAAGKTEAARSHLEAYRDKIVEDPEGYVFNYCDALILFHEQQYAAAMQEFQKQFPANNELIQRADSRVYIWRCAIELATGNSPIDPEFYDRERENTRMFYRRNQAALGEEGEYYNTLYKWMIRFYEALCCYHSEKVRKLHGLRKELCLVQSQHLEKWLIRKIDIQTNEF